jgi:transcriptional regulator with XRE-family HTH domain
VPADPRIIFGKRIRALRLECGLSQEKLAELADLHRNYVGGIEREERNAGFGIPHDIWPLYESLLIGSLVVEPSLAPTLAPILADY